MNILIGLIPAIFWGLVSVVSRKSGGTPINQVLGNIYGALIIGILIFLIKQPSISMTGFIWCFLSGCGWTFGQLTQYTAFNYLGVSTTMPISTGLQLIGNSLVGVLFFGDWLGISAKLIGFCAIIAIIIGVTLTTVKDNNASHQISHKSFHFAILILLLGTLGYVCFSSLPKIPKTNGWSAFLPQTLGMLFTCVITSLSIRSYRTQKPLLAKSSLKNIVGGLVFGLGNFSYLISLGRNGVSTGFTLSQMCVIISTLGGIYIIGEKKSHRELTYTLGGLALVVIGGVMTGFIS